MTDYGLTETGFRAKTYAEALAETEAWQRARISTKLDLSERTVLGNLNAIFHGHLAQAWEALEVAASVLDPQNATVTLPALCALTGVTRRGATYGRVTATCSFSQALPDLAAGSLLFAVDGEPTNLWTNTDPVAVSGAGDVDVPCVSTVAGATAIALAGTLTVIAQPLSGLVAVTNAEDAVAGQDIQTYDELRIARDASLAATGKATCAAIEAALLAVDGVIQARVFENDTDVIVDGIPPGGIRAVVWDGTVPAADDDAIAAALFASRGAGTETAGASNGDVIDSWGVSKTLHFDRATQVPLTIVCTVDGDTTEAAVKAALLAAASYTIDQDVIRLSLIASIMALDGVRDVPAFTLNGGTANISTAADEVATLDSSDITITVT